jgi:uncharacterized Zn-binding protein involved in type VI secretion
MPAAARVTDSVTGTCNADTNHGSVTGTIVTGSNDVYDQYLPLARIGDLVNFSCGHTGYIVTGSSLVFNNNKAVARIGDQVDGDVTGTIVSGSPKLFIER